jgi:hypothetical protein
MDVPPAGGKHFARLTLETLRQYPECMILWDPFFSNSIFAPTNLTKEKLLQDSTIEVVDHYKYWSVEYFVLHKKAISSVISGVLD